ncbi:unnamed protein product [Bursaphelenchus okinawaensis]|uniref:Uncharacterized protein n=1 Tax=Bursaphelenchus okinawaensis TaxID=465554 RepID=A0A811K3F0_9BILA|nr:unnamed protein product [Bursaphelenchus okinawaensis]CAG9091398.1 unnamed protein product [Bursaphelenchus okinawaensis]
MKSVVLLLLLFNRVNSFFHYNEDSGEAQFGGKLVCEFMDFVELPIVKMKLWESDMGRGTPIDPDDMLREIDVPVSGEFDITGFETEWLGTKFYIEIRHMCDGTCRRLDIYEDQMTDEIELGSRGEEDTGCNTKPWGDKDNGFKRKLLANRRRIRQMKEEEEQ